MSFYPPLSDDAVWAIGLIAEHLEADSGYLDNEDCPYPESVRALFARRVTEVEIEVGDLDLLAESLRLFKELKDAKDGFSVDDHSERMAYFRTSTSLLDKLVSMAERAQNVRQVSRFMSTVIDVLESELEPGQITRVREKLNDYL